MVELIRKTFCDRCGKDCYSVIEKTFYEEVCHQYNIKRMRFQNNIYHYTEVSCKTFDSRFPEDVSEIKVVLCGECLNDFGEFLKIKGEKNDNT